jgi:hypothetical protein
MLRDLGINISVETEVEPDKTYEQQMKQSLSELVRTWLTQPQQTIAITIAPPATPTTLPHATTATQTTIVVVYTTTVSIPITITTTIPYTTTVTETLTYITTVPTTITTTATTTVAEHTTAIALGVTLLVIGFAVGYMAKRR